MFSQLRKTNLIITLLITVSLIITSVFMDSDVAYGESQRDLVSDELSVQQDELSQIDDLTDNAESDTKYDGYIVKIEDGKENKVDEKALDDYESTYNNEYVAVDEPSDALDFVDPKYVEYIEPNYVRHAMAVYNGYNKPSYDLIKAFKAWDGNYTGTGANIAVFDSGLNYQHAALNQGKMKGKYNFINSYFSGRPVSYDITDGMGHGTFVTGLIASNHSAIKGIAYNSNVDTYKIIRNNGEGSVRDLLFALDYLNIKGTLPDVINMSFGSKGYSQSEYNAIKKITDRGTIVIAAVGNEGQKGSQYNYPANYSNVIGVGSVNANGALSSFSNKNSSVAVVAPGENLVSLHRSMTNAVTDPSLYNGNSGTSYSAPIVSGAVALLDQDGEEGITHRKFLTLLKSTSMDINSAGYDIYSGYGILNVDAMINGYKKGTSNIKDSYQIVYNPNGGTVNSVTDIIHTTGTNTALPGKSHMRKNGYSFSHWIDQNGIKRAYIDASYKGDDLTLTAVWSPNKYKLNFKGNGGKVKQKSKIVKYNNPTPSLKTPKKRKGYNFMGWFTKKKGGTQFYKGKTYSKIGNQTLYAHWTKSKTVKFNANGGTVSKYAKKIKRGKKYGALPKPKRSGYKFKGWYTKKKASKKVTKNTKVKKNKNMTLYARWKKA